MIAQDQGSGVTLTTRSRNWRLHDVESCVVKVGKDKRGLTTSQLVLDTKDDQKSRRRPTQQINDHDDEPPRALVLWPCSSCPLPTTTATHLVPLYSLPRDRERSSFTPRFPVQQ